MAFRLDDVVPWGRSFDEYVEMFALTPADLESRILGCGDGPASFNAALTGHGGRVVSCDPIYRFSADDIRARVEATARTIGSELTRNADQFVWSRFDSVEAVIATRLSAMEAFLADFEAGKQERRYVDASLPRLPFADQAFDLALCSHFLFLYGEQHDARFHIEAVRELARVAAETRIFPLVELGSAPSRHLQTVVTAIAASGLDTEIVRVPYEFQKGGHEMLIVRREA